MRVKNNCGEPTTPVVDIINNVNDPCLKAMVAEAINNGIEFNVKQSLNSIFSNNDDINIYYDDKILASNIDGNATIRVDNRGSNNSRLFIIDVSLNISTLPSATKEYVTATILHESLHAYFSYSGMVLQHETMATQYLNWFQSSLISIFPNLTASQARNLGWGGLQETQAYNKLSQLHKDDIITTNIIFKTAGQGFGSPCAP
jgi:hypothetical protein